MPVYIARFGVSGPVKIGHSLAVQNRLDALQAPLWDEIRLLRLLAGAADAERALHRRFARLRIKNEWFHYTDEMMGDLGLPDLHRDPTRALTGYCGRTDPMNVARSAALRKWMLDNGLYEHDVAKLVGCVRSSVEKWLWSGGRPRQEVVVRLVAVSKGELAEAFTPPDSQVAA